MAGNCSIDLKLITHHLRSFGFYQHSPSCQSEIGVLVIQNQDEADRWPTDDDGAEHEGKYQLTSAAGPVTSALPTPTLYKVIFCQWGQRSWCLALMTTMTLVLMTCIMMAMTMLMVLEMVWHDLGIIYTEHCTGDLDFCCGRDRRKERKVL